MSDGTGISRFDQAMCSNYNPSCDSTPVQDKNRRIVLDILKDVIFYAPAVAHANAYVTRNIPTYFYEVKYGLQLANYFTVPSLLNAYHETEKFMVFGFHERRDPEASDMTGKALSHEVIRMWSNFAKSG